MKPDYQLNLSKRWSFLANDDSSLVKPNILEAKKVLNGLTRSLRDAL
jgi:hypothetical protein